MKKETPIRLTKKELEFRNKIIKTLRLTKKKTLEQIGKEFGISHQAVGRVLGRTVHLKTRYIKWICPVCKQSQLLQRNQAEDKRACSKECRQKLNKYGVARNDPEYERRRRQDPMTVKRRQKNFKKKWANKEYREKQKAKMREYYRKTKK